MPGLSGLFDRKGDGCASLPGNLRAMLERQMHQPWLQMRCWHHPPFAAGQIHLGIHQSGPQPVQSTDERYVFWFDGELYNRTELMTLYSLDHNLWNAKADAQFVLDLYLERRKWDFLASLDGLFSAALFDTRERSVSLISDRLGLRPLYYWLSSTLFAFSAEIKSILALPGSPRRIDRLALDEFLAYGYMLNDRTWFERIYVLEPATILKVTETDCLQSRYWSWQNIKPLPSTVSIEEAAEEMGRLWALSVESRVATNHAYSLPLSGGLDSRAILAAIPDSKIPIPCVTIGMEGCDDIRIAARVTDVRQCPHYIIAVNPCADWLAQREFYLWLIDGLISILHLQGSLMASKLRDISEITLNGYIGDVVARGTYSNNGASALEHFSRKYCAESTLTGFNGVDHVINLWQTSGLTIEQFGVYQRARRFVLMGSLQFSTHVEQRKPFVSKDFLEFTMGLPWEYRRDGRVYRHMLLSRYPRLFRAIPWQTTGVPISSSKPWEWLIHAKRSLERRIASRIPINWQLIPKSLMIDYRLLMRCEPTRSAIRNRLLANGRYIYEYISRNQVVDLCCAFFDGKVNAYETIGRLWTVETYLRQVLEGPSVVLNEMEQGS